MTTLYQQLNYANPFREARVFALAVLVTLPALLFSQFVPGWAPLVALGTLLLVFLLRSLAVGHLAGHTPLDWPLLVLLLLMLPVGLWVTADRAVSLPRTYAFVANLALFWAVAAQRDTPWLRWSGWFLLLAGLLLGGVLLLGTNFSTAKLPFIDQNIYETLPGGLRPFWNPAGFNPNLSGGLLALFWAPAVVMIWLGSNWQQRDAAKPVAVLLSIALLLTQSRGALLGIFVALPVITLLQSRRWQWVWLVVLVLAIIGTFRVGPGVVLETFFGQSDVLEHQTLQGREELWGRSFELIKASPLTGVGPGMVEPAIKERYPSDLIRPDADIKHAHNVYLQVGAEMGLPGLVAHLAVYLALFRLLLRQARDHRAGCYRGLALGLLGSLITFLTHGFFEVITYAPRAAIVVWGLFGLMVAVATTSPPGHHQAENVTTQTQVAR